MFPLNFNFPFRKSNGELTTLGRMFENSGGGGSYTLPTASASTKGGVKIGSGLTMDGETLNNDNPTPYSLPTASAETKGGVKIGSGLTMDGETLNNDNPTPYSLPTASASTKGGVKIGSGLTMDGDTLNNNNPTPYDDSEILTDIEEINSNLSVIAIKEEKYISVTFDNSASASASTSVAKAGYTPIGVVGWYQGTGAHVFISTAIISNNNLTIGARRANNDPGTLTVDFTIYVLYVKNISG